MNPFAQLIDLLVGIYVSIILLRFFLQYFRADFYNPLSQFIVKATDPLIKPIRKIVPGFGGIDVSSLLLAYLVLLAKLFLILTVSGQFSVNFLFLILYPIVDLMQSILGLFIFLILIRIVMSWLSPGGYNPVILVIGQITEPFLAKFRGLFPATGGFDFSPMLALILIYFLQSSLSYYVMPLIQHIAYNSLQ